MLPVSEAKPSPLVVDFLEHVGNNIKWIGGNIVVKANRPVDAMALVVVVGEKVDVPLEVVMRVQRAVTN